MTAAVVAEGLRKRFGSTEALCGIDLEVRRASVLGLLGPNGAGKTTAVRILTTLLRPDGGRAEIDGIDLLSQPRRVRARIGVTGQYSAVDDRLSGIENLVHVGRLFHLPTREARRRAGDLLERFELTEAAGRPVKGYSGGMRRRLDIAMSLIGRPSVLFLDEPTTGLDPRSRLAMWDLIETLVAEGMTTLLTTQYLEEAERLADDIVLIDHGTVIERGTPQELKDRMGVERVVVTVGRPDEVDRVGELLAPLVPSSGAGSVDHHARTVELPVTDSDGLVPAVVRALDAAGVDVRDVVVRRPTLDDVFLELTGHPASAADEAGEAGETVAAVAGPAGQDGPAPEGTDTPLSGRAGRGGGR